MTLSCESSGITGRSIDANMPATRVERGRRRVIRTWRGEVRGGSGRRRHARAAARTRAWQREDRVRVRLRGVRVEGVIGGIDKVGTMSEEEGAMFNQLVIPPLLRAPLRLLLALLVALLHVAVEEEGDHNPWRAAVARAARVLRLEGPPHRLFIRQKRTHVPRRDAHRVAAGEQRAPERAAAGDDEDAAASGGRRDEGRRGTPNRFKGAWGGVARVAEATTDDMLQATLRARQEPSRAAASRGQLTCRRATSAPYSQPARRPPS